MPNKIEIGNILESLNNKVDLDAGNLNASGKERINKNSFPGSVISQLTLGASGSVIISPVTGYFIMKTAPMKQLTAYVQQPGGGRR